MKTSGKYALIIKLLIVGLLIIIGIAVFVIGCNAENSDKSVSSDMQTLESLNQLIEKSAPTGTDGIIQVLYSFGVERLSPESSKFGYEFYFNTNSGKFELLKKSDAEDKDNLILLETLLLDNPSDPSENPTPSEGKNPEEEKEPEVNPDSPQDNNEPENEKDPEVDPNSSQDNREPENEKEPEVDPDSSQDNREPEKEKEPEVDPEPSQGDKETEGDNKPEENPKPSEGEKEPEDNKEPEEEKEPEVDPEPSESDKKPEGEKEPEVDPEPSQGDKETEGDNKPEENPKPSDGEKEPEDNKEPEENPEPSQGNREPEGEKEPEVDPEPSESDKKPEAEKEPEVDPEPSESDKNPEDSKEPEVEKEPEDNKEPEGEKGPEENPTAPTEPILQIEDFSDIPNPDSPAKKQIFAKAENGGLYIGICIDEDHELKAYSLKLSDLKFKDILSESEWIAVAFAIDGVSCENTIKFTEIGNKILTVSLEKDGVRKDIQIPVNIKNVYYPNATIEIKENQYSASLVESDDEFYTVRFSVNSFDKSVTVTDIIDGSDNFTSGSPDNFDDNSFKFVLRINGSEHIFTEEEIKVGISCDGIKAKDGKIELTYTIYYFGYNGVTVEDSINFILTK